MDVTIITFFLFIRLLALRLAAGEEHWRDEEMELAQAGTKAYTWRTMP